MSKFETSFRYYEHAAPYPGICLRCSTTSGLWDLGRNIAGTNMGAYYCDHCLTELSFFAGFVFKKDHEAFKAAAESQIGTLAAQLENTPKLIEKVSHDVNSILSNFVVSIAGITGPSKPVQLESDQAVAGEPEPSPAKPKGSGQGKSSAAKSSS